MLGYRAVAVLTALMVLLQPILAGQFVYGGEPDLKDVHAVVGQSLHITVGLQLILAFLARRTFGIGLTIFNLVLLVLIIVQAGIGFSDDGDIIAIHIPLGTIATRAGDVRGVPGVLRPAPAATRADEVEHVTEAMTQGI